MSASAPRPPREKHIRNGEVHDIASWRYIADEPYHPTADLWPFTDHKVRCAPNNAHIARPAQGAWNNEYVELFRDDADPSRATAYFNITVRADSDASVWVVTTRVALNLREETFTLPATLPRELVGQTTIKAQRVLDLLTTTRLPPTATRSRDNATQPHRLGFPGARRVSSDASSRGSASTDTVSDDLREQAETKPRPSCAGSSICSPASGAHPRPPAVHRGLSLAQCVTCAD